MEKHVVKLRVTLDEGPKVQGPMNSSNLIGLKAFKLVPRPLDEGPRPKSGKFEANMAPLLEGKSIG
jgi:hypothetical protein